MDNANIDTPTEELEEKNKLKSRGSRKSALDFRKYTKQIWLAGLGAFSRAEEEGNKLFDSLVKVGEELESKTGDLADNTVGKVTEKAKESVFKLPGPRITGRAFTASWNQRNSGC